MKFFLLRKTLLLLGFYFFAAAIASAQLFTLGSGTTLYLTPGTDLYLNHGDFLNQPGGVMDNSATIHVTNDWINNGGNAALTINQGTVDLNGSTSQHIKGNSTTEFNELNISNGSGSIVLNTNTNVGGTSAELILGSRNIDLNSQQLLITNSSISAITHSSGYIISETPPATGYGSIGWTINTSTGNFVFPFGSGSSYIPFTFNITSAGTGNGNIVVSTFPTITSNAPNNRPWPTGVTNLNDALSIENANRVIDRFWPLTVSGFTTLPVASLNFTYQDNEWDVTSASSNVIAEGDLKAQRWNSFGWLSPPLGATNTSSNTTTITGVDSFNSVWTLVDVNYPLPVTLLSFEARWENEPRVKLTWQTGSELNSHEFEVWRSEDGNDFSYLTTINTKALNGISMNKIDYEAYDVNPFPSITFYKLRMLGQNGEISYSPIRSVKQTSSGSASFTVSPNPASNTLTFFFNLEAADVVYCTLINSDGKILKTMIHDLNKGTNSFSEELDPLSAGIYYLQAKSSFVNFKPMKLMVVH